MFNSRTMIWLGAFVGGALGGWLPTLWGASMFSFASIIGSGIGGLLGIWAGYQLGRWL